MGRDQMNDIMLREIQDQPSAVTDALRGLRDQAARFQFPGELRRIVITGSGDSLIAAEAVAPLYRTKVDVEVQAVSSLAASRYLTFTKNDLLIVVSVSGEVVRSIEAALRAKSLGATVLAIVARSESRLSNAADAQLVMPKPLTRATPHSRDYTLTLVTLTVALETIIGWHFVELDAWPAAAARTLEDAFQAVSEEALYLHQPWFLGAGPDTATAMYGALKFWEAGLRAYYDDLEEFGHGSQLMAQSGQGALLIATGPGLSRAAEMLSGIHRMGLVPYVISADPLPIGVAGLQATPIGDVVWSPFVTCLPLQVLTYRAAAHEHIDVTIPLGGSEYGRVLNEVHVEWTKESKLEV